MTTCTCTSQRPYMTGEGVVICDGCGERIAKPTAQELKVELAQMRNEITQMRVALDQISEAAVMPQLITAEELADRLGMSRSWIYLHAADLGGKKINGALRFDPRIVVERTAPRPFQSDRRETCTKSTTR
jgi:hypothetical protein